MKIQGSVALVTGANRGIGQAIAAALLSRGAEKVYAGVRDPGAIDDPGLVPVALDITDPVAVSALLATTSDVQIVVNNAGIGHPDTPLTANFEDARSEMETNYLGLVSMTQTLAPLLAENGGGAFVNMLSVLSWIGVPHLTTYSASKAAAWAYTNAARVQLSAQGTQVVAVYASYVDTDFTAGIEGAKITPEIVASSALDALEAGHPEAIADDFSRNVKAGLADDQTLIYPTIREQFATSAAK